MGWALAVTVPPVVAYLTGASPMGCILMIWCGTGAYLLGAIDMRRKMR